MIPQVGRKGVAAILFPPRSCGTLLPDCVTRFRSTVFVRLDIQQIVCNSTYRSNSRCWGDSMAEKKRKSVSSRKTLKNVSRRELLTVLGGDTDLGTTW